VALRLPGQLQLHPPHRHPKLEWRLLIVPRCVHFLVWEAFLLTNGKLGLGRTVEFNIVVKHYCGKLQWFFEGVASL
jgi:hypothetical protein